MDRFNYKMPPARDFSLQKLQIEVNDFGVAALYYAFIGNVPSALIEYYVARSLDAHSFFTIIKKELH